MWQGRVEEAVREGASMRVREIFWQWLPLAISFEMMMLEAPTVQSAMGHLPDQAQNIASFGLAFALSLLIESPVLMLIATSIALVRDAQAYHALRTFMIRLALFGTFLTALIAYTPLFDFVAGVLMKQPPALITHGRPALQIMLLWTAAIAWRRFYQGILVRYGETHKVTWGTGFRLTTILTVSGGLAWWGKLPGAQVAATSLMASVIVEAFITTLYAMPLVRRDVLSNPGSGEPPLTQGDIFRFHAPLAFTTLLTFLAMPLTSAALGRLPLSPVTLAAWPVAFSVLLVIRGGPLALQEISVAQARRPNALPALKRFTLWIGVAASLLTLLFVSTPLLTLYFDRVLNLQEHLRQPARLGVWICLPLPLITALGSWARGLLVASGKTQSVYQGMGVNLTTHVLLLTLGVVFRQPGMIVAASAFTLAPLAEYLFLYRASHSA